ncbi:hypothetical protein LTR97_008863 [Elasticomyces elasticus]|uniref:F-box domain-containing protein n=1 Tax=Elasticomyces elasticus TaxID=574655 RepID=A0AAN8A001_9PEZI|nr:hypothetical protein LTR97_008863 [Elasticomyces elasticus]KAK5714145.1 hypothetical protein LTR15_011053 [Elasticomyces elasticus]
MGKARIDRRRKARERNKTQLNLLGLPPELRNQIIDYCVEDVHKVHLSADGTASVPSLAQTCRQFRQEILPVWYARFPASASTIKCHVHNLDFQGVFDFLPSVAVHNLDFQYGFDFLSSVVNESWTSWLLSSLEHPKKEPQKKLRVSLTFDNHTAPYHLEICAHWPSESASEECLPQSNMCKSPRPQLTADQQIRLDSHITHVLSISMRPIWQRIRAANRRAGGPEFDEKARWSKGFTMVEIAKLLSGEAESVKSTDCQEGEGID